VEPTKAGHGQTADEVAITSKHVAALNKDRRGETADWRRSTAVGGAISLAGHASTSTSSVYLDDRTASRQRPLVGQPDTELAFSKHRAKGTM